jgi:hypothetical protein
MSTQNDLYDTEQELEAAILRIDTQDKQIAALKTTMIKTQAELDFSTGSHGCPYIGDEARRLKAARNTLKSKLPMIDWEDMK